MADTFAGFSRSERSGVPVLFLRDIGAKTFRITVLWRRPMGFMHAARAILPALLQHGTALRPDRPSLARARELLYGAGTGFGFSRHAEQSVLRLSGDAIVGSALPGEPDQFRAILELMSDQATKSRALDSTLPTQVFERERAGALAEARAITEDRARQARLAAVLAACEGEPYGIAEHGGEAAIAALSQSEPSLAMRDFLERGSLCLLLAGALPTGPDARIEPFLSSLPQRSEGVMPAVAQPARRAVRVLRDRAPMRQAKLVLAFRAPVPTSSKDLCALQVAMSLWGGGPHSRLFTEVREKRSLCYYASAGGDADKGLVLMQSGCDAASTQSVVEESMRQLAEIAAGRFSEQELATAVAMSQSALRGIDDSPGARLAYTTEQFFRGFDETPLQRIATLGSVQKDAVARCASSLWLDVDYALLPEDAA